MTESFSSKIPNDNVFVIPTADDLPQQLDQWRLYHLLYDPGAGIGLYYSPDNSSLVRLASGGGGGGVTTFEGRSGVVVAIEADYAGFYVDTFEGRVGTVVAIEDDYEDFYLVKGAFPDQNVVGDINFTGDIEFNNVGGVRFGISTEIEMRNNADDTTFFIQYSTTNMNFGLAGPDFNDIYFDFSSSFTHFRFGDPILLREITLPINGPSNYGQLWVKDDDPNVLMYTDGNDDDFVIDMTPA